jgi:hypothetical protein
MTDPTHYDNAQARRFNNTQLAGMVGKYGHISVNGAHTEGWISAGCLLDNRFPCLTFEGRKQVPWHPDLDEVTVIIADAPTTLAA